MVTIGTLNVKHILTELDLKSICIKLTQFLSFMKHVNKPYQNKVKRPYWDKEQQSKARNSDRKYRQMALVRFDT